jgi:hypothetical protein
MCRVLGVSRSGYYEWRTRSPSLREQADERLSQKIEAHVEQTVTVNVFVASELNQ